MEYNGYENNELYSILQPLCRGYETSIVHLSTGVVKSTLQVRLVLHKKGGIGIDECGEVSRAVLPRLEIWADSRDMNLEVSSPGIGRTLKDAFEFSIFTGERVKLLINSEWIEGTLKEADTESVTLENNGDTVTYSYGSITKAKLN